MSTTPVVAIITAKPGKEQELETRFRAVIATTLREEGCIQYQLNRDAENPLRFVWTEEWVNKELLERHLAAPHIADLFSHFPDLVENAEVIALNKLAGGAA